MLHRYVLHNDEIREAGDRVLSPGQVGLLAGWGVFSTIKVIDGVPFAFERHWARMSRDAAALRVPMPSDAEPVRRLLLDLVAANGSANCTLRLVVVRNHGGMWSGPGTARESDLVALTADTKDWGEGVRLCYTTQARHSACPFAGAKVISWAMNLTWLEQAQAGGYDETVLLNERGEVAECTSANIFAAKGGLVWTPPLASGCLPGITRELLLSEVRSREFPVVEKIMFPGDLENADEVFITSTTRDLLPVLAIEGRPMGTRGEARESLQRAFTAYVARYTGEHRGEWPQQASVPA